MERKNKERKTSEMICGLLFKSRKFSCVTQAIRVRFILIFFRAFICLCLDENIINIVCAREFFCA